MTWRAWIVIGWLGLAPLAFALDTGAFSRVDVPAAKTSIYLGWVTLTTSPFERQGETYVATYRAKVFPFSFYNENGTLQVEISDAQLEQLTRGETIEFTGAARNGEAESRRITGKAAPSSARAGKLKVRVGVTPRIELIFNTTYTFPE